MNIVWRPAPCLHLINRNPSREDDSEQSLFFGLPPTHSLSCGRING